MARNIHKQLVIAQDIKHGVGKITQQRGQTLVTVDKVDIPLGLSTAEEVAAVDKDAYPRVRVGSVEFQANSTGFQQALDVKPLVYAAGVEVTSANPYVYYGQSIFKRLDLPYVLVSPEVDDLAVFDETKWSKHLASDTSGVVQEVAPANPFPGLRWYKPSSATTYIYDCSNNACAWMEEPVQSAEGTLRSELAATDSDVLVGGIPAGYISGVYYLESVAKIADATIPEGAVVAVKKYYPSGEQLSELTYKCKTLAQSVIDGDNVDEELIHTTHNGNVLTPLNKKHVDLRFAGVSPDVVDNSDRIQAAFDFAEDGGKVFYGGDSSDIIDIGKRWTVNHAVSFDGGGATFNLVGSQAYPNNMHFDVVSSVGNSYSWAQTVSAGDRILNIASSDFAVGSYAVILLGEDPDDPNEQHWAKVCRVLANSGTTITIDTPAPFDINDPSRNLAYPITRLVSNCVFENFKIDYSALLPDTHIFVSWGFNVTLKNITSIKSRILINAFEMHNLTIENISGEVVRGGYPSHGRVLSLWGVENAEISNINAVSQDTGSMILLETWCRNISFENVVLNNLNAATTENLIAVAGSSYNVRFDNLTTQTASPQPIIDASAQTSEWTAGHIDLRNYPKSLNLARVESFTDYEKGIKYIEEPITQSFSIPLTASMSDAGGYFCSGVLKEMWVYVSNTTELSSFFVLNQAGGGVNIKSQLVAGQWKRIGVGFYGTDYQLNNPSSPSKRLSIYTTASMPTGTIQVVVKAWRNPDTGPHTFKVN